MTWCDDLPATRQKVLHLRVGGPIEYLTENWFLCRRGRITASTRSDVLQRGDVVAWRKLADELRAEMEPDYERKDFDHPAMAWGRKHERQALDETSERLVGNKFRLIEPGFMLHPLHDVAGATPDGLLEDYTIQIKCPFQPKNHMETVNTGTIKSAYYSQVNFESYVSGKPRIIFGSFDPRIPSDNPDRLCLIEVPRDAQMIERFEFNLEKFRKYFDCEEPWPTRGRQLSASGGIDVGGLFT
jgi:hypothetical protein